MPPVLLGGHCSTLLLSPLGTHRSTVGLVPAHTLHPVATLVLLTTAFVRTPSAWLAGAMGRRSWPQPVQAWLRVLPKQHGYVAFLCRGKSKAALTDTGLPPCPVGRGSMRGLLSGIGEADVTIREGQDAEAVGWCVPVRGSLVWGVAGQD